MASLENIRLHPKYCYLCDTIHDGPHNDKDRFMYPATEVNWLCPKCDKYHKAGECKMFGKTVDELEAERIKIWNEAIEAAVTMAIRTGAEIVAENIRSLKKMSDIKIEVPEEMYLMKPNLIEIIVRDNEIKIDNVYAKAIWNAALERAALRAERTYQHGTIAKSIRKLKK